MRLAIALDFINKRSPGSEVTILTLNSQSLKVLRLFAKHRFFPSLNISWITSGFWIGEGIHPVQKAILYLNANHDKGVFFIPSGVVLSEDVNTLALWTEHCDLGVTRSRSTDAIFFGRNVQVRELLIKINPRRFRQLLYGGLGSRRKLTFLTSHARIKELPYTLTARLSLLAFWRQTIELVRRYRGKKRAADICILAPRADLPFKSSVNSGSAAVRQKRFNDPVRKYWHLFPRVLEESLRYEKRTVERRVLPNWAITPELIKGLKHDLILVPHRDANQIKDPRCIFYMQEVFPEFFTVDKKGWAAGSQSYGSDTYKAYRLRPAFDKYLSQVRAKKHTKFQQHGKLSAPDNFLFFPLQLPHDEVIKRHSDDSFEGIANHVLNWCHNQRQHVLVKKHPFGKRIDYIDDHLFKSPYIHFREVGHVHDYIKRSKAVILANSGVGFEALIYNKPVVCFAKAMYEPIVGAARVSYDNFGSVLGDVLSELSKDRQARYEAFLDWYLSECGTILQSSLMKDLQFGKLRISKPPMDVFEKWHHLLFETDPLAYVLNEKLVFGLEDAPVHPSWPSAQL
jgi:hypothetical protein